MYMCRFFIIYYTITTTTIRYNYIIIIFTHAVQISRCFCNVHWWMERKREGWVGGWVCLMLNCMLFCTLKWLIDDVLWGWWVYRTCVVDGFGQCVVHSMGVSAKTSVSRMFEWSCQLKVWFVSGIGGICMSIFWTAYSCSSTLVFTETFYSVVWMLTGVNTHSCVLIL